MTKLNPLEADVKKSVKELLDDRGWFWWMVPQNGFGRSGVSDLHALKNGVFIAIEAKLANTGKKARPSALQRGFLNSVNAHMAFGFVVNAETTSVLKKWLDAFERSTQAKAQGAAPDPEDGAMMLEAIRIMTEQLKSDA
jgi:hypothetical protein